MCVCVLAAAEHRHVAKIYSAAYHITSLARARFMCDRCRRRRRHPLRLNYTHARAPKSALPCVYKITQGVSICAYYILYLYMVDERHSRFVVTERAVPTRTNIRIRRRSSSIRGDGDAGGGVGRSGWVGYSLVL